MKVAPFSWVLMGVIVAEGAFLLGNAMRAPQTAAPPVPSASARAARADAAARVELHEEPAADDCEGVPAARIAFNIAVNEASFKELDTAAGPIATGATVEEPSVSFIWGGHIWTVAQWFAAFPIVEHDVALPFRWGGQVWTARQWVAAHPEALR